MRPAASMRKFQRLLDRVKALPPMTEEEKREQFISLAWGNLACSTNHKVSRELVEEAYDKMMAEKNK